MRKVVVVVVVVWGSWGRGKMTRSTERLEGIKSRMRRHHQSRVVVAVQWLIDPSDYRRHLSSVTL